MFSIKKHGLGGRFAFLANDPQSREKLMEIL